MIDVEMADDIRKYETKTLGMFTTRQLVALCIGAVYSLPIALLIPVSFENKLLIFGLLMAPAIICGFTKMDGTNFEVVAIRMIYTFFLTPAKRKRIQKNTFREAMEKRDQKEEKIMLSKMSDSKRKEYEKNKKKKVIKYSNRKEFKVYK